MAMSPGALERALLLIGGPLAITFKLSLDFD